MGVSVRRSGHPSCSSQRHLSISPGGMPGGAAGPAPPLPELRTHTRCLGLSLCSNASCTPLSFPLQHQTPHLQVSARAFSHGILWLYLDLTFSTVTISCRTHTEIGGISLNQPTKNTASKCGSLLIHWDAFPICRAALAQGQELAGCSKGSRKGPLLPSGHRGCCRPTVLCRDWAQEGWHKAPRALSAEKQLHPTGCSSVPEN